MPPELSTDTNSDFVATTGQRQVASFRDPSGFVFKSEQGQWLRQINHCYKSDFDLLMGSGLYESLVIDNLLIEHQTTDLGQRLTDEAFRVIEPVQLNFVSYPYEWSFSQLQDAALLTLEIQLRAREHGMSLKDASSYNVQFVDGRATFIDTLSFERLEPGTPWVAYGQFCRHFLAPLALMSYSDVRLGRLLSTCLDGVPLDLTHSILPWRSRFNFGLLMHIVMHSRAQRKYQDTSNTEVPFKKQKVSDLASRGLVDSLKRTIQSLRYQPTGTEWSNYYQDNSYTDQATQEKQRWVKSFLEQILPKQVWDLGANSGKYSRLAAEAGAKVISFDIDPACVEMNYLESKKRSETDILPLVLDLTNPSGGIGWAHSERDSLADRGPADAAMALALIHHLAISGNITLSQIASYFRRLANNLIIEFVPKEDPQVKRLLRHRKDHFAHYNKQQFELEFRQHFEIKQQQAVGKDGRILYLMSKL